MPNSPGSTSPGITTTLVPECIQEACPGKEAVSGYSEQGSRERNPAHQRPSLGKGRQLCYAEGNRNRDSVCGYPATASDESQPGESYVLVWRD